MHGNNYGVYNIPNIPSSVDVWTIVSFLVALCGGIVLYFTFLNPKNAENYTGITKKIYDFLSFKSRTLEAILKICYLVFAIFVTISSFSMISTSFVAFLLVLFLGNVIVRLVFEGTLLILMIYRKLCDINDKMAPLKEEKKKNETPKEAKKIEVKLSEK